MFGRNLRKLRNMRNLTMDEVVSGINKKYKDIIHINKGNLSRWENEKSEPVLSTARVLADFYGVTVDDIVEGKFKDRKVRDISVIYNQLTSDEQEDVYNYAEEKLSKREQIQTVVTLGKTAAGEPIAQGDIIEEEKEVSNVPSDAEVALVVQGDSMEPDYKNGSVVFYKRQPQVENGELAVVHIKDDGITFKKLLYDYDNEKIILRSLNDKYEDRIFEENEISVLGKVIN